MKAYSVDFTEKIAAALLSMRSSRLEGCSCLRSKRILGEALRVELKEEGTSYSRQSTSAKKGKIDENAMGLLEEDLRARPAALPMRRGHRATARIARG